MKLIKLFSNIILKNLRIFTLALLCFCAFAQSSHALSEYGNKCDENKKCVTCRDTDVKCNKCMNACWNLYGPAEINSDTESRDKEEICRLRRAKWCNAQCWDPDDKTKIDYETTKPDCSEKSAFPKYKNGKRPW